MGMGVEMMRLLESIGRSERKYFFENFILCAVVQR